MLNTKCCDSSHGELFCWSQWDSSQYVQLKLQSEGFEIFAMSNICLCTGHHTRFFHSFPGAASLCSTAGPKGLVHSTRRSLFQSGPCTIPDYYWCVCSGLLQQQAGRLLIHTSGASVPWEPVSLPLPTPPAVKCSISHQGASGRLVLKWGSGFWEQRFLQPRTVSRGCWWSLPVGGIVSCIVCVGILWLLFLKA